mmetsp:Transcript_20351/g.23381  ORF Transcript_20351/g.23381 Transcript_20351/m.23381 type:complete len:110 (-) Transcript_20351:734-1063(-)
MPEAISAISSNRDDPPNTPPSPSLFLPLSFVGAPALLLALGTSFRLIPPPPARRYSPPTPKSNPHPGAEFIFPSKYNSHTCLITNQRDDAPFPTLGQQIEWYLLSQPLV